MTLTAPGRCRAGAVAAIVLVAGCSGEIEQRTHVHGGTASLIPAGRLGLQVGSGPKLGGLARFVVQERRIVVVGAVSRRVYEYGEEGEFRRQVGARGRGEGEYLHPTATAVAVAGDGSAYVYDGRTGRLLAYDATGAFVEDVNRGELRLVDHLAVHESGDLLLLGQVDGVAVLRRLEKGTWDEKYSVEMSTRATDSIVIHLSVYAGFIYNRRKDRVYYVVPTDFRIKEVDAASGRVVSELGVEPPGYRPLPEALQGLGEMESPDEMAPVWESATLVQHMTQLDDRYLMVAHRNAGERQWWWVVHDLDSPEGIYYVLSDEACRVLHRNRGQGWEKTLYVYSPPTEHEKPTGNGTFTLYTLGF